MVERGNLRQLALSNETSAFFSTGFDMQRNRDLFGECRRNIEWASLYTCNNFHSDTKKKKKKWKLINLTHFSFCCTISTWHISIENILYFLFVFEAFCRHCSRCCWRFHQKRDRKKLLTWNEIMFVKMVNEGWMIDKHIDWNGEAEKEAKYHCYVQIQRQYKGPILRDEWCISSCSVALSEKRFWR